MTIYYVKQDDTISGCGDPECCGEYYEDYSESFIECYHENVTAEHLHSCNGGGPVLDWREATYLEATAFRSGVDDGYYKGWDYGVQIENERILKQLNSYLDWAIEITQGKPQEVWEHSQQLILGLQKRINLIKGKTE